MRLAIIRTHPTQYFSPLFSNLSKVQDLQITIFYVCKERGQGEWDPGFNQKVSWDVDLLSGYHYEFVTTEPLPFKPKHIFECRSPELIKRLKEGKFDAIFCAGYALWLDWQVIYFALRNGIPLICRPELNDLGVKRGWLKKTVRDIFLRWYFSKISAFLYIGHQAKNGFLAYGGITSKTFFSPYSVDNSFFSPRHVRSRVDLKKEFGFHSCNLVLLYVGKLISCKGVDVLIQSIKRLERKMAVGLLLVGDGPERENLLNQISGLNLETFHFAGFQNQSQLPKYYHTADVLVVPSLIEPWGLVVNEAMAAGTPVIASDRVGSAYDLVEEGRTGYIFESGDPEALAKTILKFYQKLHETGFSQEEILAKVSNYSLEKSTAGFVSALKMITKKSPYI